MVTRHDAAAGLRAAADTIQQLTDEKSALIEKVAELESSNAEAETMYKVASDGFDGGLGAISDSPEEHGTELSLEERLSYIERGQIPPQYTD